MRQEIKKASDAELSSMLVETRKQLREERFAAAGSRPKDTNAPAKNRRQIARILTEQKARTMATK
ncbi:MAG: 50S ribosomal protein L29 [Minisyncoccia bacterium]